MLKQFKKITICGCSIFHTFKWLIVGLQCWSYRVWLSNFYSEKIGKANIAQLGFGVGSAHHHWRGSTLRIQHDHPLPQMPTWNIQGFQGLCCPIGAKWSRNLAQETLMANSGILCSQRCPRHWFSRSSATWTISVASKTSRQLPNLCSQDPVAKGQQC